MGLFSRKDWNVIAITFERKDLYQVNGNRCKGTAATTLRDGVKRHDRTIYWATFDQKGAFLEGEAGLAQKLVPQSVLKQLIRELHTLKTVREILNVLEEKKAGQIAKPLDWNGYPRPERPPS